MFDNFCVNPSEIFGEYPLENFAEIRLENVEEICLENFAEIWAFGAWHCAFCILWCIQSNQSNLWSNQSNMLSNQSNPWSNQSNQKVPDIKKANFT